jgi:hypothetical protein
LIPYELITASVFTIDGDSIRIDFAWKEVVARIFPAKSE